MLLFTKNRPEEEFRGSNKCAHTSSAKGDSPRLLSRSYSTSAIFWTGGSSTQGAVVCKKCFRQLEKLINLRRQQVLLKKEMQTGVERVGQPFGIVASTSSSVSPVKRSAEHVYTTPPKKRRLAYDISP